MDQVVAWWRWLGWRRIVGIAFAVPLVIAVLWWMVQLPAPSVEHSIPVATTVDESWLAPLDTVAVSRIAVHVVGAVQSPGVYHLSAGSRADDAVRAAGGPTREADVRRVNLAATLADGAQLIIPRIGERLPAPAVVLPPSPLGNSPSESGGSPDRNAIVIVDLNQASVDELDRLPGIGPSTARAIVDHRTRNGPFASVEDLLAVRGIGPAKLAELRPWVRV